MSKHREAFKAFLELQQYCDNTRCEECCFCLGNDHDNEGYCVFDGGLAQADDEREEISKRVYFLEQLELEMGKKMSEDKLKPCPFCGGEAKVYSRAVDWLFSEHLVRCKKCHCITDTYDTKEEAAEAWNRRYKERNDD